MIVGNFKSTADKEAKLSLQKSLLDVEIANEAEREKRQQDFKNPYKAVVVPPQSKSNAELQKDRIEQERQAIANMTELGFDYQKGAELSAWLSSSLINKLVAFNANFKGIKKELVETTNPKLLSLDFLKNYLEKYFEDMDVNYGRKFSRTEQGGTPATSTVDELEQLLPFAEDIGQLILEIERTNQHLRFKEDMMKEEYADLLEQKANAGADKRRHKRIKMIEKETDSLTETRRKGYQFIALLKILEAVTPSQELLNLLRQNLTQTERADLIRRYVILLRKAKVISNAELNEILAYFQGGVRDNVEDIKGVYRRLDSSLGFLTNDAEINSLTKLQRDYETLLSQSGKPINLDSIRKYAEVRDIEIEKAREAFKNAGFYEGPEFDGGEDLQRIAKMRTEIELRDAIRAPNLRALDAYDEPIRTRMDKFGNVWKVGDEAVPENKIIATMQADDEAQAFRALEDQKMRRMYGAREESRARLKEPARIYGAREEERARIAKEMKEAGIPPPPKDIEEAGVDALLVKSMGKYDAKKLFERIDDIKLKEGGATAVATLKAVLYEKYGVRGIKRLGRSDDDFLDYLKRRYMSEFERANFQADEDIKTNPRQYSEAELGRKKKDDLRLNSQNLIANLATKGVRLQQTIIKDIMTRPPFNIPKNSGVFIKSQGQSSAIFTQGLRDFFEQRLNAYYDSLSDKQVQFYEFKNIGIDGQEYGYGIRERLQDHFKEDKKYLTKQASKAKDIKKIISQHIMETEPIEEKIDSALGGLGFKHTRIKVGKGITAVEQPQYKTFGKYVIHYGHLIDRNIANFKYPSLGGIPAIKPLNISEDYKEFLIDTINTGKANERALKRLPEEEQKHFERVVVGAGLLETFNLKRGYGNGDEKKDSDRFTLLRGEVMAGNNNDKLLKELRLLIIKLMGSGRISRSEGTNMLIELSAI